MPLELRGSCSPSNLIKSSALERKREGWKAPTHKRGPTLTKRKCTCVALPRMMLLRARSCTCATRSVVAGPRPTLLGFVFDSSVPKASKSEGNQVSAIPQLRSLGCAIEFPWPCRDTLTREAAEFPAMPFMFRRVAVRQRAHRTKPAAVQQQQKQETEAHKRERRPDNGHKWGAATNVLTAGRRESNPMLHQIRLNLG